VAILASASLELSSPSAALASPRPAAVHAIAARRSHSSRDGHARAGCRSRSARLGSATPRRGETPGRGCLAGAHRTARATPRHAAPASPPAGSPVATAPAATPPAGGESPAATIATVLATPCQNTELMPEAGNLALIRAAVLCLINRERAQNGASPLKLSNDLTEAAEGHSSELIADDYFAHVAPDGETPVDRIRGTGYIPSPADGYVIGENLAWGTYGLATPQAIVSAWIASPEHLANILERQYVETGIGVAPEVPASLASGAPGATYAQEFGVIIR